MPYRQLTVQDRERAMLEVAASIPAHSTIRDLFRDLVDKLSRFVHFDRLLLLTYNEEADEVMVKEMYSTLPHNTPVSYTMPAGQTPAGEVIRTQKRLYIADIEKETRYPELMSFLRGEQLRTFGYLPLGTASHKIGALGFATRAEMNYTEADLDFLEQVTGPVAVAVENILNRAQVESERDRLRAILEVNNALVTQLDSRPLFDEISRVLQRYVPHEFLTLAVWSPEEQQLRLRYAATQDAALMRDTDYALPLDSTPTGLAFSTGAPQVFDFARLAGMAHLIRKMMADLGIRSACSVPLRTARGRIGAISVGSREDGAFSSGKVVLLESVASQLAIAVENATAFSRVEELNRRLSEAKLYLEEELNEAISSSDEMLGTSAGMRQVLQQIETVAPTDATVLISGQTGSGKELVARALHHKSARAGGTFVKLNCAAIPTGLLESELFGHERGAFTGAIAQKIGRFEIAHQGTLFLDEIGEIPLELQPKLLRVLQEKEFERLGGVRTIRTDARLVAATNRDLKKMVEAGQFRGDLYYRLNVFPIHVPSLRERKEDIPLLAMHFTREYSRRFGRHIQSIPSEAIDRLVRYPWPGNIRELQNLIERSVILSSGDTLRIPLQELEATVAVAAGAPLTGTMEEVERETIRRAISECNGVIGGPKGAAAKLGMKRTTLLYRMDKLGINGR